MVEMHNEEKFFREKGFGLSLGFGNKIGIIVVDLICGFTDATMPLGSDLTEQITNTNKIIDIAHKFDIPVFFTTISYEDDSFADAGIWYEKMEGLRTLKEGTQAVKVDPRLHFTFQDGLIKKKYASAFFGTDLTTRLNTKKIDTVIVTGSTTSGCVRATVVDALQYGYRPIVVEDAVGDRTLSTHSQSIFDMKQKYADIMTTEMVVKQLAAYEKTSL